MAPVAAVVEANEAGCICFAFAYPGACGWGPTQAAARGRLRADLRFTLDWLDIHGLAHLAPPIDGDITIELTERVPARGDPLQCDSEGFFAFDRRAYTDDEVTETRELLTASRADLLETVSALPERVIDRRLVEGRRTVREILEHVALAEHWYLTRIQVPVDIPAQGKSYPTETSERLAETRGDVDQVLESFVSVPGDRRTATRDVDGERWSPRKVLRRLPWHELLHYKQVTRLVPKIEAVIDRPDGG